MLLSVMSRPRSEPERMIRYAEAQAVGLLQSRNQLSRWLTSTQNITRSLPQRSHVPLIMNTPHSSVNPTSLVGQIRCEPSPQVRHGRFTTSGQSPFHHASAAPGRKVWYKG